jgi:hypothetical protein
MIRPNGIQRGEEEKKEHIGLKHSRDGTEQRAKTTKQLNSNHARDDGSLQP